MFKAYNIVLGRVLFVLCLVSVLGAEAKASLYVGPDMFDGSITATRDIRRPGTVARPGDHHPKSAIAIKAGQTARYVPTPTGHHPDKAAAVKSSRWSTYVARPTGHHPYSEKYHALPELRRGLFSSFNLKKQKGCLAVAIYYEARSEEFAGQVAIGQVILNRVKSRKYPNSICGVVYQNAKRKHRCQFSFACDGKIDNPRHKRSWQQAIILASMLSSKSGFGAYLKHMLLTTQLDSKLLRSTHYHATYARPIWRKRLNRSGQIGQHIFYISKRAWS